VISNQCSVAGARRRQTNVAAGPAADRSEYVAASRRNEAWRAFSADGMCVQASPHGVRAAHSDVTAGPAVLECSKHFAARLRSSRNAATSSLRILCGVLRSETGAILVRLTAPVRQRVISVQSLKCEGNRHGAPALRAAVGDRGAPPPRTVPSTLRRPDAVARQGVKSLESGDRRQSTNPSTTKCTEYTKQESINPHLSSGTSNH
jgi:hypothetical protein